jgi:hypothetical protein
VTRAQIRVAHIDIRPDVRGLHRHCRNALVSIGRASFRPPGKLDEYPTRVEHARAHRLHAERRRRDRRRARSGRGPIRLATSPRRRSMLPLAMRQQVAGFVASRDRALRRLQDSINAMVVPLNEAMAALGYAFDQAGHLASWPARFATGGVIHEHRDPDDDTILAFISPGEAYVPPAALERYGPGLFQRLNGPGPTYVYPLADDDAHSVGEQNECDFRAVARTLGPPLGELPDAATWRGDVMHRDRYLGEGNFDRDETSSVHSTDSSGTGAVWTDLMDRIDDLIDGEGP